MPLKIYALWQLYDYIEINMCVCVCVWIWLDGWKMPWSNEMQICFTHFYACRYQAFSSINMLLHRLHRRHLHKSRHFKWFSFHFFHFFFLQKEEVIFVFVCSRCYNKKNHFSFAKEFYELLIFTSWLYEISWIYCLLIFLWVFPVSTLSNLPKMLINPKRIFLFNQLTFPQKKDKQKKNVYPTEFWYKKKSIL